ncbi:MULTISPECIES: type I-F CRISPR-associated protein Csy3 [Salinimonas]|uniref:Type I-F CRISPR-associated protein Csy3 n=2 Tax=Salinimonas TaxID=288793 RepID=A0A5B7YJ43_9ALTE|nr:MULTISPECIES: type I-F CRISPR-associated protein Csy3 [Salinimonas]MBD3587539.1 type I-F CRISPR-associated protein Csy3 [Salinimonas profundi]QCZ95548.1 type I-F CRISPR-associated protein Csy3 [Salinimonas iocasae]
MAAIKTASVLAFERKLANSDGLLFAGNWATPDGEWKPITLKVKSVRGTISNRQKNTILKDPAKLDQEVNKANLQTVDTAALPFDCDTLKVVFSLRVLGDLATPSACNSPEYQEVLRSTIESYIEEQSFDVLAHRYASNIANGRFLWRNRVEAEDISVRVTQTKKDGDTTWVFNGYDLALRNFDFQSDDLKAFAKEVQKGLTSDAFAYFQVEAFVKLGEGQEVFPSQELVLDGKSDKSKVLYHVDGIAALHSQKIGNAIRTVDTWHQSAAEVGPISAEPFGSVTSRGKAYRNNKDDFYTLFDKWMEKGQAPELDQQHYVIANLIRGGVFGGKSDT